MFQSLTNRKQFVVTCKKCQHDVPSALKEVPFHSIIVECCPCSEEHRYLPSEVFLDKPDHRVAQKRP